MMFEKIILGIAGKEHFELDKRISYFYILRLCWNYAVMIVRGKCISLGRKRIANNIFCGKKIKLYEKRNITIGEKTKLHDGVKIDALSTDGVKLGKNVVLGCNTIIECTGSIQCIGKGIEIGDRTTFGRDCFFGAAGGIKIGEDVVGGQYIRFHSENHNYSEVDKLIKTQGTTHKGITVGNNCWIGSGVVFLDGAEIGDGCVVAANAVVNKKYPDNSVIGGVPSRVIKSRV